MPYSCSNISVHIRTTPLLDLSSAQSKTSIYFSTKTCQYVSSSLIRIMIFPFVLTLPACKWQHGWIVMHAGTNRLILQVCPFKKRYCNSNRRWFFLLKKFRKMNWKRLWCYTRLHSLNCTFYLLIVYTPGIFPLPCNKLRKKTVFHEWNQDMQFSEPLLLFGEFAHTCAQR